MAFAGCSLSGETGRWRGASRAYSQEPSSVGRFAGFQRSNYLCSLGAVGLGTLIPSPLQPIVGLPGKAPEKSRSRENESNQAFPEWERNNLPVTLLAVATRQNLFIAGLDA
jgi:hypothetical protein